MSNQADIATKTDIDDGTKGANLVGESIDTGYGNHQIIFDVSVHSRDGIVCIFGPNGSGKSTLLKTLAGLIPTWSGTIYHNGEDITNLNPREILKQGIVSLPQDGGLFNSLTVKENLLLGGHIISDDDLIQSRLEEVYEMFPVLEEKKSSKAKNLSGGQQMMVSFGRVIVSGADTFLLDEPSAGLAPNLVDDVFKNIEMLAEQGKQVILVEQNVTAALQIADYVYILAQGRLQFDGEPSELAEQEELLDLYLGIT